MGVDVITHDVLSALVEFSHMRFSDRELYRRVCELRVSRQRNGECSFVMVNRVLANLITARVVEAVQFSGLHSVTDIGKMLLGKAPVTPGANDHLRRTGFHTVPFYANDTSQTPDLTPALAQTLPLASAEPLGTTKKEISDLNAHVRLTTRHTPPHADALHLSDTERYVLGLLYEMRLAGQLPVETKDFKSKIEHVFAKTPGADASDFLVQLAAKGFLSVKDRCVSISDMQVADLGWGDEKDALVPFLHLYGLSAQGQLILRHIISHSNEDRGTVSIASVAQCLRAAGMIPGDQFKAKNAAKHQLQTLEAAGLLTYSNGMFRLPKQAMVLLGVKAPTDAVVKTLDEGGKFSSMWAVCKAHMGLNMPITESLDDAPVVESTEVDVAVEIAVDGGGAVAAPVSESAEAVDAKEIAVENGGAVAAEVAETLPSVKIPFLDIYGFSDDEKIVLADVVARNQCGPGPVSISAASQALLRHYSVEQGNRYGDARLIINALVQKGFVALLKNAYFLQAPGLFLLGVVPETNRILNRIAADAALRSAFDVLQAFKHGQNACADQASSGNECNLGVDLLDSKSHNGTSTDNLPGKESAMSDTANSASTNVFASAIEALKNMASAPAMPVFENVSDKVSILEMIANSFAYDQPDVQSTLLGASSLMKMLDTNECVVEARIRWAQSGHDAYGQQQSVISLLMSLAQAFRGDQLVVSQALTAIAEDLKTLSSD